MTIRKDHLKLIAKMAWSFHYTTGMEFDDLYGEGCLAYCEAMNEYNHERDCKLTTYVYTRVQNHLINFSKRNKMIVSKFQAMPSEESGWEYGEDARLGDFNDDLSKVIASASEDVQTTLKIVLTQPEKYALVKPKFARGIIRQDLHELGWKWERVWTAIRDTKIFINETLPNCII